MKKVCITGSDGFVGHRLIEMLEAQDVQIVPFDLHFGQDIRNKKQVMDAFQGCDIIFHMCSYGMSGAEMKAPREKIHAINVGGTRNVIEECNSIDSVKGLVYVSSVNVCFTGNEDIVDGREDFPYPSLDEFEDNYSRTKCEAEQLVLAANCDKLRTCSIRPYGIYGKGEQRHFPRMINIMKTVRWVTPFGPKNSVTDWTHRDNVCHSMILASKKLDGKAYFIGDNEPVHTFEFAKPLVKLTKARTCPFYLPAFFMHYIGWVCELCGIPLLSRCEVKKVARTHYWQWKKSESELGYRPIMSRAKGAAEMWRQYEAEEREAASKKSK